MSHATRGPSALGIGVQANGFGCRIFFIARIGGLAEAARRERKRS